MEETEVAEPSSEETMENLSEDSQKYPATLQSQEPETEESKEKEKSMGEIEQKFEELLRIIREETLQLSEFLIEEKKLTHELYVLLKPVLKHLNTSFNIPTKLIPHAERAKQIFLNAEGHLILIDENNAVTSKALEDCPPEVILNVLWITMPALSGSIMEYRKRVSFRVNLFNRINRELKNLHQILVKRSENLEDTEKIREEKPQEDAVRKSLQSKK